MGKKCISEAKVAALRCVKRHFCTINGIVIYFNHCACIQETA